MHQKQFVTLIAPLLRHLNVPTPEIGEGQAISIDFKHLQLRLTPLNEQELLIVASLGALPVPASSSLAWMLLEANDIDPEGPPICVSAIGAEKLLILWSRERFTLLNPTELISLFERMVSKANSLAALVHAQSRQPALPEQQGARAARTARSLAGWEIS